MSEDADTRRMLDSTLCGPAREIPVQPDPEGYAAYLRAREEEERADEARLRAELRALEERAVAREGTDGIKASYMADFIDTEEMERLMGIAVQFEDTRLVAPERPKRAQSPYDDEYAISTRMFLLALAGILIPILALLATILAPDL